jgi:hypothetical protein
VPQSIAAAAAACQETGRCSLPVTGCYHFENLLGPGKKLLVRVPEIYCWLSILVPYKFVLKIQENLTLPCHHHQSAFPLVAYPTSPKSFNLAPPLSPAHPLLPFSPPNFSPRRRPILLPLVIVAVLLHPPSVHPRRVPATKVHADSGFVHRFAGKEAAACSDWLFQPLTVFCFSQSPLSFSEYDCTLQILHFPTFSA